MNWYLWWSCLRLREFQMTQVYSGIIHAILGK